MLRPTGGHPLLVVCLAAGAVVLGGLIARGHPAVAVTLVLGCLVTAYALAEPERAALALIVAVPFLFYPASVGGFSIYLGLPIALLVSVSLMLRTFGAGGVVRSPRLPSALFVLLLVAGLVSTALSREPSTGVTRLVSLTTFAAFGTAIAFALANRRLTTRQVARAVVVGAALAGLALTIQSLAQIGLGKQAVFDWLIEVRPSFQGARSGESVRSNWYLSDLDILRGVFPFMSPPSAGQYMMGGIVAAVWLRREDAGSGPRSTVDTAMLAIMAVALLATFSRQSWIGVVVGLTVLALHRRSTAFVAAIVPLAVALVLIPVPGQGVSFGDYLLTAGDTSTEASNQRVNLWSQALEIIPDNSPFGTGPGQYGSLNRDPVGHPIYYAHNVFLDGLVELGVGGGAILIVLASALVVTAWRRRAALAVAMLSAYLTANLFDDVLYFPRNGLLLGVAVGLIAAAAPSRPAAPAADSSGPVPRRELVSA
jgi:O-antigen ligase